MKFRPLRDRLAYGCDAQTDEYGDLYKLGIIGQAA